MSDSHEWILVVPDRRQTKWHLWHVAEFASICSYADKRLQTLLRPAPHRRFRICQMCRRYAERNDLSMPKFAITPNRRKRRNEQDKHRAPRVRAADDPGNR